MKGKLGNSIYHSASMPSAGLARSNSEHGNILAPEPLFTSTNRMPSSSSSAALTSAQSQRRLHLDSEIVNNNNDRFSNSASLAKRRSNHAYAMSHNNSDNMRIAMGDKRTSQPRLTSGKNVTSPNGFNSRPTTAKVDIRPADVKQKTTRKQELLKNDTKRAEVKQPISAKRVLSSTSACITSSATSGSKICPSKQATAKIASIIGHGTEAKVAEKNTHISFRPSRFLYRINNSSTKNKDDKDAKKDSTPDSQEGLKSNRSMKKWSDSIRFSPKCHDRPSYQVSHFECKTAYKQNAIMPMLSSKTGNKSKTLNIFEKPKQEFNSRVFGSLSIPKSSEYPVKMEYYQSEYEACLENTALVTKEDINQIKKAFNVNCITEIAYQFQETVKHVFPNRSAKQSDFCIRLGYTKADSDKKHVSAVSWNIDVSSDAIAPPSKTSLKLGKKTPKNSVEVRKNNVKQNTIKINDEHNLDLEKGDHNKDYNTDFNDVIRVIDNICKEDFNDKVSDINTVATEDSKDKVTTNKVSDIDSVLKEDSNDKVSDNVCKEDSNDKVTNDKVFDVDTVCKEDSNDKVSELAPVLKESFKDCDENVSGIDTVCKEDSDVKDIGLLESSESPSEHKEPIPQYDHAMDDIVDEFLELVNSPHEFEYFKVDFTEEELENGLGIKSEEANQICKDFNVASVEEITRNFDDLVGKGDIVLRQPGIGGLRDKWLNLDDLEKPEYDPTPEYDDYFDKSELKCKGDCPQNQCKGKDD